MSVLLAGFMGLLAGTLRALQGSYKDAPWEEFEWTKFVRSMMFGTLGGLVWWIVLRQLGAEIHPAMFFGMAVFFDSMVTELYKRAFRIEDLRKYKMPTILHINGKIIKSRILRGLLGGIIAVILGGFFWWLYYYSLPIFWPRLLQGIFWGGLAGLLVAVGGALLDTAWEGFEVLKFPRSIVHGIYWGALFSTFEINPGLLVFAVLGMDRMGLEFYKSFIRKMKSGKFLANKPTNLKWYETREKILFPYMLIWMIFIFLLATVR